jgi:multicomponent Na+:H+ antiporter subunit E
MDGDVVSRHFAAQGFSSAIGWRLAMFTGAWFVLTGTFPATAPLGVAVILAATATSLWLQPVRTWRWHVAGFLRFVPYFLRQSIVGGLDVARRALAPRNVLTPGMVEYAIRLPEGPPRRFFAAAIGLLPGTLTAEMHSGSLTVHVVDRALPVARRLRELEDRTAALFGLPPLES